MTSPQEGNRGNGAEKLLLAALAGWVTWQVIGESGRQKVLGFLDSAARAHQQQLEEQERQRRLAIAQEALRKALLKPSPLPSLPGAITPLPKQDSLDLKVPVSPPATPAVQETDARWRQVIIHPSVILILGKRGSGKSALGYRLLELFRYGPRPYVVGVPGAARSMLPDWIGIAPRLENVPPKSIALVDEAYLHYHARGSMATEARAMSQLVNLSRQREQTIIFVTQEARQVDRNIASSANVVVFKDLGMLQLEFDRPELNKLAAQAREAFAAVRGDRRRWSFVYAPDADFLGLLENELPTFWKPSLSHLFAAGPSPSTPRAPRRMTSQDKAQKAREMQAQGLSYGEIARALGIKSRSTIQNYLKGYPYQR